MISGVPILADEPDLRLISLQHNSIKRIQHLDTTFRLVFLDLYHNRLEQISGLEPLTNLRVLMLGKNRIRRIEGLQRCCRLSVLDLHGNRITQVPTNKCFIQYSLAILITLSLRIYFIAFSHRDLEQMEPNVISLTPSEGGKLVILLHNST